MKNLEEQLTEILADSHVHEVLRAWLDERRKGALSNGFKEAGTLDNLIRSQSFCGRYSELTDMKDEMEALHKRGQNELNK